MAGGFFNWRGRQPGSTPTTSRDQYQWPAWPSHHGRSLCLIRASDGDNCFLHDAIVERVGDWLSGIDCLGQPISPMPQQKAWEACMAWPMEQSGTRALLEAGKLSREGYYGGMVHAVFLVQKRFMWANTFRLDCSVLGQPSGPVTKRKSWKGCVRPMKQTVPDTCAIMACIVAVEGMHRKVYEASHGKGKFAWKAAEVWPEILRAMCKGQNIWKEGEGANTGRVLDEIIRLRGVGIASDEVPITMPLRAWEQHVGDELLTPERVAALLDQGPCVGRLWVCPWYYWFDTAKNNDDWIYRGCGRDKRLRDESRKLYGKKATGSHAVVCFGYRFCKTGNGEETMCVLVMDNHDNEGPQRWIDVEELDAIYTLSVDCLA